MEVRQQRQALMLKEWMELESTAEELSRDGFGCYPRRHLAGAAELRSAASGRRGRNGDVIARFSAAVRAALHSRPQPAGRDDGEAAAALSTTTRSLLSRRLRGAGFWRKRRGRGDAEETTDRDRPVASRSATAASSSGRRGAPSATSPRRASWEGGRQGGGDDGAGLSGGRRSHETLVEGCECETTCRLDEEREQRLSPVSVMDFLSQDGEDDGGDEDDHDCDDNGGGDGKSEHDGASPTFEQSLANIRRASQQLLQRIRRFEQLAEIDADDATTAEDTASCCHVEEEDLDNSSTDHGEGVHAQQDTLLSLPVAEAGSPPRAAAPPHCFKKLLHDFFREGLSSSCQDGGRSDDPELEGALLENAKAWLDGRHRAPRPEDGRAEVEEIERLGRWRWFREDERELLGSDVEGGIFWSLVAELVDDLC